MDSKNLELLLHNLNNTDDSIKKTANYCSSYPESASLAVFNIEQEFLQSRKDRKKLYLFLIHEIILDEKAKRKTDHSYIRTFGAKLKMIFQEYSNQIDDIQDMEKAYTIIKRWERDQIYHPQFLDKLRQIMQSKFDLLKQQKETFDALNQTTQSTNKVLQHQIQVVQQHEQSHKVYLYLKQLQEVDVRTLEFNCTYDKQDKSLQHMIEQGDSCRSQIIENICLLQEFYKEIALYGETILNDYNRADSRLEEFKEKRAMFK